MLSDRQSLGSGCRPGRRRSRESRISADVRTGESGDRSTPSAPAQSSTRSLSGTATVPPGSSSPTMDSASRLAWSVTDSTASRSDRSSISDIGSAMIDNPPLPRGLFGRLALQHALRLRRARTRIDKRSLTRAEGCSSALVAVHRAPFLGLVSLGLPVSSRAPAEGLRRIPKDPALQSNRIVL
jgi:hypothetical protein